MRWLLRSNKLSFVFIGECIACRTFIQYQINGILSFAILDLAYKIVKQHKSKSIILKKRKPIIHLLNYVDVLNFNSKEFDVFFFSKNRYKTKLANLLHHYRSKYFKDLDYKDWLKVIVSENSCTIRFDNYPDKIPAHNANLVVMITHILEKEKGAINVDVLMFYCLFLM